LATRRAAAGPAGSGSGLGAYKDQGRYTTGRRNTGIRLSAPPHVLESRLPRHRALNRRAGGRAAPQPSTERTSSLASAIPPSGGGTQARSGTARAAPRRAAARHPRSVGAGAGAPVGVRSLSDSRHLFSCEYI
jgi:hypothetical protein